MTDGFYRLHRSSTITTTFALSIRHSLIAINGSRTVHDKSSSLYRLKHHPVYVHTCTAAVSFSSSPVVHHLSTPCPAICGPSIASVSDAYTSATCIISLRSVSLSLSLCLLLYLSSGSSSSTPTQPHNNNNDNKSTTHSIQFPRTLDRTGQDRHSGP